MSGPSGSGRGCFDVKRSDSGPSTESAFSRLAQRWRPDLQPVDPLDGSGDLDPIGGSQTTPRSVPLTVTSAISARSPSWRNNRRSRPGRRKFERRPIRRDPREGPDPASLDSVSPEAARNVAVRALPSLRGTRPARALERGGESRRRGERVAGQRVQRLAVGCVGPPEHDEDRSQGRARSRRSSVRPFAIDVQPRHALRRPESGTRIRALCPWAFAAILNRQVRP